MAEKVKALHAAEAELQQINQAIEALGGRAVHNIKLFSDVLVNGIVGAYQSTLSWPEKVKYAVARLGHATVQEIITEIKRVDPELAKDHTKVFNNVTSVASQLASKGELTAYKDGIKNVYSIPKK